jgi:hypothetical protein
VLGEFQVTGPHDFGPDLFVTVPELVLEESFLALDQPTVLWGLSARKVPPSGNAHSPTIRFQHLQSLADRGPGQAELSVQLALARQPILWSDGSLADAPQQFPIQLLVVRDRRRAVDGTHPDLLELSGPSLIPWVAPGRSLRHGVLTDC